MGTLYYGHNTGDIILIEFSNILESLTREVDIVARWGGDELLIICPETNLGETIIIVERLMQLMNNRNFDSINHLTVSVGFVMAKINEILSDIVDRADRCLYRAKNKGKNGYCFDSF